MKHGSDVVITANGPMGTLTEPSVGRFADETVTRGDRGKYWGTHLDLPQWHMIRFEIDGEERYCPLHEAAFAEAE